MACLSALESWEEVRKLGEIIATIVTVIELVIQAEKCGDRMVACWLTEKFKYCNSLILSLLFCISVIDFDTDVNSYANGKR